MQYQIKDTIKGDTFDGVQFTLTSLSEAGVETPVNLTSATILMQLRKTPSSVVALALTSSSGITITNASSGIFQINNQIVDIEAAMYYYDIQITFPNSTVKTYITGTWKIIQDISHG